MRTVGCGDLSGSCENRKKDFDKIAVSCDSWEMELHVAPSTIREHGDLLIRIGKQLLAAADALDTAKKMFTNGSEPAQHPHGNARKRGRPLGSGAITVDAAAKIISENGGSMHKDKLFDRLHANGATVKTVESLVSTLRQDKKNRFESKGKGVWGFQQSHLPLRA